jgi:hypothetical protein
VDQGPQEEWNACGIPFFLWTLMGRERAPWEGIAGLIHSGHLDGRLMVSQSVIHLSFMCFVLDMLMEDWCSSG